MNTIFEKKKTLDSNNEKLKAKNKLTFEIGLIRKIPTLKPLYLGI